MAVDKAPGEVTWASVANVEGRRTAHEFVKDSLRRAILRGDLNGGARLIQADLAAMLNVSTTPVREALRDLATEGLITLDRHRGGVVRELNWSEMEEIRLIRQQLEPLAVELVVERITNEQLREADRLRQRMSKERDLGNWVELNTQFHLVFHESTGIARLAQILMGFEEASAVYVAQAQRWHPEIRRKADAEHQALIEAFRDRDGAQYAVSMAHRIRFVMQMSAREAMHLIELRSGPQGHPTYRRVAQQMHELIERNAGHRAIAAAMTFVDYSDVDLERLEAERRAATRRTAAAKG